MRRDNDYNDKNCANEVPLCAEEPIEKTEENLSKINDGDFGEAVQIITISTTNQELQSEH